MKNLTKQDILEFLKEKKEYLNKKYGLVKIGLFGSFAREEANPQSDIDLAIDIKKEKKNIHNFFAIKRELEELFGRRVDLGFESSLKKSVKKYVEKEIVYV